LELCLQFPITTLLTPLLLLLLVLLHSRWQRHRL
jgi:hypothetical protein